MIKIYAWITSYGTTLIYEWRRYTLLEIWRHKITGDNSEQSDAWENELSKFAKQLGDWEEGGIVYYAAYLMHILSWSSKNKKGPSRKKSPYISGNGTF